MRCGSACQMSVHEIFLSVTCSHLIQAPCCLIPTALRDLSSATALTSSWTSCLRSFPQALSKRGMRWFLEQPFLWSLFPSGFYGIDVTPCSTAASALHFLPVLTVTSSPDTFGSTDSQWPQYPRQNPVLGKSRLEFSWRAHLVDIL